MSTIASQPSLKVRLENSVCTILRAVPTLAGLRIVNGVADEKLETPYLVVNVGRGEQRIHDSGIYNFTVNLDLHTTAGDGPKSTTDAELLELDAGIEEAIFEHSTADFADIITANGEFLRVDAVINPNSEATEFNNVNRNINYNFTCVCLSVDA